MSKARSDFRLGGRVEQFDYRPGSPMRVILEPTLYGLPVALLEPVEVEAVRPDGYRRRLLLARAPGGAYVADYFDTGLVGPYQFSADVAARTPGNVRITRHRVMTGIIFVPGATGGGSGSGAGGGNGGGGGGTGGELEKCCKEMLARLDRLVRVVEQKCGDPCDPPS